MNKYIAKYLCFAALAAAASSCTLHQTPEGEGNDPTEVIVNADINLQVELPQSSESAAPAARADEENPYTRRFVVEALSDDNRVHDRQVFFMPVEDGVNQITLPVNMRLHARNYRLLVWSDFVQTENPETSYFYDIESLTPVLPVSGYKANNEYKDAFSACTQLDLRPYENKWQASVNATMKLTRPVGRYQLVTTDVAAFQCKVSEGTVPGTTFTARIRYAGYIATGYNVAEEVPKNMLNFLRYNTNIRAVLNTDAKEFTIGFDFVIACGDPEQIPVEIEILNENETVVSNCSAVIPLRAGYNTTVRGRFLTATSDGGVNVDSDYDGTIDVDLGPL